MTVLVFGTFDVIHKGHIDFFRQAREFGDCLAIVVAKDENAKKIGKKVKNGEQKRLADVRQYADLVFLGHADDYFKIIEEVKPDVICLGYDQHDRNLQNELRKRNLKIKVVRLKPFNPEKYHSSLLNK